MTLLILKRRDFQAAMKDDPELAYKMMIELAKMFRRVTEQGDLMHGRVLPARRRGASDRRDGDVGRPRRRRSSRPTTTLRDALVRAFRRTPVVIDDTSFRRMGTSGEVMVQPGDLQWFRAVALARVPAETGLTPRFVSGVIQGGYDPAANYRPFEEQLERLDDRARTASPRTRARPCRRRRTS